MESVFKNLEGTAQLLAVAQSEFVEQWDVQTVDRAFKWCRYCEKLYDRFNANTGIKKALEDVLRVANEHLGSTFNEYRDVTFSDLGQCQYLLLTRLFKNPAVSHSVTKHILDLCSPGGAAVNEGGSKRTEFYSFAELARFKSAVKLLSKTMNSKRGALFLDPNVETLGTLLRKRLDTLLMDADFERRSRELLEALLKQCGDETRGISVILAAAVLSNQDTEHKVTEDFIIDWLLQNRSLLQSVCCSQSVELLAELARRSKNFWNAYIGILQNWTLSLEYDLNGEEWTQTSATGVKYETLIEHFRSLFRDCSSFKEETEMTLSALRSADGNFEVKGLSVWGDILVQLKN